MSPGCLETVLIFQENSKAPTNLERALCQALKLSAKHLLYMLAAARANIPTSQTIFPWNQLEIVETCWAIAPEIIVFFFKPERCASFTQNSPTCSALREAAGVTRFWHRPSFLLRLLLYWPLMKLCLSAADNMFVSETESSLLWEEGAFSSSN